MLRDVRARVAAAAVVFLLLGYTHSASDGVEPPTLIYMIMGCNAAGCNALCTRCILALSPLHPSPLLCRRQSTAATATTALLTRIIIIIIIVQGVRCSRVHH